MAALHDPNITLTGDSAEAWREYRRDLLVQARSPRTLETYGTALCAFQLYLNAERGGLAVIDAAAGDVKDFLIDQAATRSQSTAANRYRCLRQFYKWAASARVGLIEADPMLAVPAVTADYRQPSVLPEAALAALLKACQAKTADRNGAAWALRDEAMLRVWCEAGSPRASEMAALNLADIDLDAGTITIQPEAAKNRLGRTFPIAHETARAIWRWKRARARLNAAAHTDAAWIGPKGRLTRWGCGQMLQRRGTMAGVSVHPHQLRHTAFADFDAASGNVNHEMALFGWRSSAMAGYYGKSARKVAAINAARELSRGSRLG